MHRHYDGGIALRSTCRQIYAETKDLPPTLNTIGAHSADLSHNLYCALSTRQLNTIPAVRPHTEDGDRIHGIYLQPRPFDRRGPLGYVFIHLLQLLQLYPGLRHIDIRCAADYMEVPETGVLDEYKKYISRCDIDLTLEIVEEHAFERALSVSHKHPGFNLVDALQRL